MGPEHPDSCEVTIRPLLDRQRERELEQLCLVFLKVFFAFPRPTELEFSGARQELCSLFQ